MGNYSKLIKWLQAEYAFTLTDTENEILESWIEENVETLLLSDNLEAEILSFLSSKFPWKQFKLVEDDNSNDVYILNLLKQGLGK